MIREALSFLFFGKAPKGEGVVFNPKILVADFGNFKKGFLSMNLIKGRVISGFRVCFSTIVLILTDFLSYIFSVSENTKIIHLIMMIWLLSFIVSNYKLASGPPKDPGGSKKILSKSKDMIHRIISVKNKLSNPFLKEWLKYF